jgi:hypothetical protein
VRSARKQRGYDDAIVVANMRTASSFLIDSLGSHSDISAFDGEVLLPGSPWREKGDNNAEVLTRYYSQVSLSVLCAKVTYVQVGPHVLDFISANDLKVMHLTRDNVLRLAFSAAVNMHTEDPRYGHICEGDDRPEMPHFDVDPTWFMKRAQRNDRNQVRMRGLLDDMPNEVLHLTYRDVVGGEGRDAEGVLEETVREICDFLGVPYGPLISDRRKSNPWPMSEVVANWDDVKEAISHSKYMALLQEIR